MLIIKQSKIFILYALIVWFISQITLHILLYISSTFLATLISQILYICMGYSIYSKKVFTLKKYNNRIALKFAIMSILLWTMNWKGISILLYFGFEKYLAAIFLIPFLASSSFLIQKYYVFKTN